jgi:hypothetical protein
VVEESDLFGTPPSEPADTADGSTIEERLDGFAAAAKEATQLAGKLRLSLTRLADNAQTGGVATVEGQVAKLVESVKELSGRVDRLADQSRSLRVVSATASDYMGELRTELTKRGVTAVKGPEPYWLAHPAWFKLEEDGKGSVGIVLNGERLDSIRPTVVASKIADAVNEKFQVKHFADLLISVRDLLRRAGANNDTLRLDDIYEVLAMEPGRRGSRGREFSRESFYYSVHRVAEEMERTPRPTMSFPAANRSDMIFFTRDGESRKYLTIDFAMRG